MQTQITKVSDTEAKIERMMAVAALNSREINRQLEFLEKQKMDWFFAYHALRTLNDVGREASLTEESLAKLLQERVDANPTLLVAKIAVENR